eukprot:6006995-Prymnesium_polylepis.1
MLRTGSYSDRDSAAAQHAEDLLPRIQPALCAAAAAACCARGAPPHCTRQRCFWIRIRSRGSTGALRRGVCVHIARRRALCARRQLPSSGSVSGGSAGTLVAVATPTRGGAGDAADGTSAGEGGQAAMP